MLRIAPIFMHLLIIFCVFAMSSAQASDSLAFEPVEILSGEVRLAGEIARPAPETDLSIGVVLLPGSGPADLDMLRPAAERLMRRGLTVIYFDKRGVGESGGDWRFASLTDLAQDAIAARDVLAQETALPVSAIGLWGHSQGVWVATEAIGLGAEPAFLMALSGGGIGPRQVETEAYLNGLARAGAQPSDIAAAGPVIAAYFDYLSGAIDRAALDHAIAGLSERPWAAALNFPVPSEANRANWAWVAGFDPAAIVQADATPVLVMLGGRDHSIPVEATLAGWRASLAAAPSGLDEIVLLPERDHHLNPPSDNPHGGGDHFAGLSPDPRIWDRLAAFAARAAAGD